MKVSDILFPKGPRCGDTQFGQLRSGVQARLYLFRESVDGFRSSGSFGCERSATTEVVQLLGNACLSPITLAPKGPFRPRGPGWIRLFSLDSVEPHRVNSNDLVAALGVIPAALWRTSHDVLARLMFSSRADSFSPANRLHPHYQRANPSVLRASPFASVVYNNHRSFTYAASVA